MSGQERSEPSSASAGRLVAVIVTHNRLPKLRIGVEALLAEPADRLAAILVVDNASTDGTGAWLAGLTDPRLQVLTQANLGGAGGFEAGMRRAVAELAPDWLLLFDDDAWPAPGALAAFHGADLRGWDAVAAAVYLPDGAICDMNRPGLNPFARLASFASTLRRGGGREAFHLGPADYAADRPPRRVDIASFVGLFVSARAVGRVGYPDGRLFVYAEDGLYTLRLSQAGGRVGFFPAIRFVHDCGTLSGGRFRPLWKVYYYHRNLLMLYRQSAGWMLWPVLAVVLPRWILKVRHHRGERRAFLRLLRLAIGHGLTRRTPLGHARIVDLAGPPPGQ